MMSNTSSRAYVMHHTPYIVYVRCLTMAYASVFMQHVSCIMSSAFCAYVYLYLSLLPSPSIYVYMNVGLPRGAIYEQPIKLDKSPSPPCTPNP